MTHWFAPSQKNPRAQSPLPAQVVGHVMADPSQRYGEQLGTPLWPSTSGVQVPRLPEMLHASQALAQALLQQYPSTHRLLSHSFALPQISPSVFFGTHWLAPLQ
jgi:hypothetical protein